MLPSASRQPVGGALSILAGGLGANLHQTRETIMQTNTPNQQGRGFAHFSFAGIFNAASSGDLDAADCDAATLPTMALSVLPCLYTTLAEDGARGAMSREQIADVVAVAAGMLELSGTVKDFVRDNREDAL